MPSSYSQRLVRLGTACLLAAIALSSIPYGLVSTASARDGFRLSGGLRIVSVHPRTKPPAAAPSGTYVAEGLTVTSLLANVPPLDGPLTYVVMTVTDERSADESDFYASAHAGLDGAPLPGATTNQVLAIFDSGGGSHLVSYPDAVALGLQGDYLSGETLEVGGIVGSIDMEMSMPVGFFAHGIQDLDASGQIVPALTFGQGNFIGLVNTPDNHLAGDEIPTILGTPFFAYFAAYVQNSQRIDTNVAGQAVSTAAVSIYPDPTDPQLPVLEKRILLQIRPGSSGQDVLFLGVPGLILLGPSLLSGDSSLFFTANDVTLGKGVNSTSGSMAVDTGAQATLISRAAATALGLNLQNPDFEVEVQGIGSASVMAPGFYIDKLSIPVTINQSGAVTNEVWNNVPVVAINVGSPEGGTMFGILGMNLLGNRDYLFNGALPSGPFEDPYLDITEPFIPPELRITDIRKTTSNTVEIDWLSQPAAPVLHLESTTNLASAPVTWSVVATGDLPMSTGTMVVTGLQANAYFRLHAP
jgi:hypothetical protein